MKILHAAHNFPPEFVGGTEAYVAALVAEQARRGHEVLVLAGSERPGVAEVAEQCDGSRILRLGHDQVREPYSIDNRVPRLRLRYRELLAAERPDLVHVHHYLNLGVPLVADAARAGIPAVLCVHDFLAVCPRFFLIRPDGHFCGDDPPVPAERCLACCSPEFNGTREELAEEFRLRRALYDAEFETARAVVVPSRQAGSYLAATGILRSTPQYEVVPLGLLRDLDPVEPVPAADGRLRLVFFGNVAPVKGVDILLEALAGLAQEQRDRISLLLLGKTTQEELARKIDRLAEGLDVVREETFDAARLERLPGEADVAVFPSTAAETYSLVVDEALALGLPLIVTDRGAAAERAGPAAAVVKPGDVASLRAVLAEFLEQPGRLAEMRLATASRVFTLADGADRLEEIYRRVLAAGAPVPGPDTIDTERLAARDSVVARLQHRTQPATAEGAADRPAGGFDATFRFRPLRDFRTVPEGLVVVLAPHPDDEIIGAGGAIALHAARGDEVVVVHLTDGGSGDRRGQAGGAIARVRREEARAAGELLGVRRFEHLDFPDGGLRPGGAFLAGLRGLLAGLAPAVLYVPSPFEHHPDHRAAYLLATAALEQLAATPAVFLYEVNEPQQASFLLDISGVLERKEAALRCFSSQQAYMDIVTKTLDANRARTVNVDLAEVRAAEAYLEIRAERLADWGRLVGENQAFLDAAAAAPDGADAPDVPPPAAERPLAPVSAVISTWNKKDDVRQNLLALTRQTTPPAEIIVVDNASTDGTQAMIRAEFPGVKIIATCHDRVGACETFNLGFRAVSQPLTAIMDDDVVAPPEWLEILVKRLSEEPETTAMISSKVIEPGMPEEFISSERVNRPRYMATFRGCGTLARTAVLRQAGYYDEKFFIYGNERDLATRVLNLGCRILQLPQAEIFHKTPFGMKAGRRSLYYHVRNFWLYAFKNCSWPQVFRAAWVLGLRGLGLERQRGHASDATGTIGLDRSIRETPGGVWIAFRATLAALFLLPYCLRRRQVCRAPDFEPPVK